MSLFRTPTRRDYRYGLPLTPRSAARLDAMPEEQRAEILLWLRKVHAFYNQLRRVICLVRGHRPAPQHVIWASYVRCDCCERLVPAPTPGSGL